LRERIEFIEWVVTSYQKARTVEIKRKPVEGDQLASRLMALRKSCFPQEQGMGKKVGAYISAFARKR
jgi:hypothetical protein